MAHDDNENGFHGDRFLMDTTNSRQYVIRYQNGSPQKPFQVFAQDVRDGGFKPNEVIFALDDEVKKTLSPEGKMTVSTVAYQITVNKNADPLDKGWNLKNVGVEYEAVLKAAPSGGLSLTYKLTTASEKELAEANFADSFPKTFSEEIDAKDPGIRRNAQGAITAVEPAMLLNLSFPAHHQGGAASARINAAKSSNLGVEPEPEDQKPVVRTPTTGNTTSNTGNNVPTTRPSPTFNNNSGAKPPVLDRPKVPDAAIEAVLKQYCLDLTDLDLRGKLDPVVGRNAETKQAIKVLSRRKQASMCFTGDAGVGKTAMFAGVAQYINRGEGVPANLQGARILQLDLQAMNAGAKFRGQFEEKLKPLIDGLQEREGWFKGRKIILAIDEIHSQGTAGKAEGGTDALNMMKPFLTSKGIAVMATTTAEEYKKHIEKDPALSSRFEPMVLGQPDAASTKIIMEKLWPGIKAHHNLVEDLADEDLDYIISMTNRYAPNVSQPRKSEKAIDMAAASAQTEGRNVIEKSDLISAIAQMSKLDESFLNQSDNARFLKMETELPKEVLGQPNIMQVTNGLIGARSGLNDPNQPWGCFVLQGPTGVGKTELCKALARHLFGTEDAMIQLNMGEYQQEHSVSRLIGAPPGFVGFDTAEPALTEKVRQRPYTILLLDEIEKAHPKVFDTLLPILNDGKMEDNQGKTVLFNNVIVVMTTNLGASAAATALEGKASMAMGGNAGIMSPEKQDELLSKIYASARTTFFRPEMINRIDELGGFITFIPLSAQVIGQLVTREIGKINKRLSNPDGAGLKGVTIEVTPEVEKELSKMGYNPAMGARPMRKAIRQKIGDQLGKFIMANKDMLLSEVAEKGAIKLVISSITDFKPTLVALNELATTASVSNDNVDTPVAKPTHIKKPAAPKK